MNEFLNPAEKNTSTLRCRVQKFFPAAVFFGVLLLFSLLFYLRGDNYLNADISSEVILADQLNREGTIMSPNWYYSSEIRIFSQAQLYQIGLLLFPGNWHMARLVCVFISLLVTGLSAVFLGRGAGMRSGAWYFGSVCMIPFSESEMFLLSYGCFYALWVTLTFLIWGLLIRTEKRNLFRNTALLFVLALFGGLSGVKILMLCCAQALLVTFLYCVQEIGRGSDADRKAAAKVGAAAGMFSGAMTGYLINKHILARYFTFDVMTDSSQLVRLDLQTVFRQIECIFRSYGCEGARHFISRSGLIGFSLILIVIFLLVSSVRQFFKGMEKDCPAEERIFRMLPLTACVLGILINCVTGNESAGVWIYSTGYFLPGFLLLAGIGIYVMEKGIPSAWVRQVLMAGFVAVFGVAGIISVNDNIMKGDNEYRDVAGWLMENGYTQGFSSFWSGNAVVEASDGQLEMWILESPPVTDMKLKEWLQDKRHTRELPEGKTFLLVSAEEVSRFRGLFDEKYQIYYTEDFYVYGYDSAEQMMALAKET